jgi:hypothetical protein
MDPDIIIKAPLASNELEQIVRLVRQRSPFDTYIVHSLNATGDGVTVSTSPSGYENPGCVYFKLAKSDQEWWIVSSGSMAPPLIFNPSPKRTK